LRLVDDLVAEAKPDGSPRARFGRDVPVIFVKHADSRKRRAKDRYLMTAQIFTVRFATADLTYFPLPLI
jgi:hypothetical protein